jgi:hypothetical protein
MSDPIWNPRDQGNNYLATDMVLPLLGAARMAGKGETSRTLRRTAARRARQERPMTTPRATGSRGFA